MRLLLLTTAGVVVLSFPWSLGVAQPSPQASSAAPTIRVESSLVLVDVITEDPKNGLPVRDLRREDFRMFNDRQEVPISAFDAGARYDTRP